MAIVGGTNDVSPKFGSPFRGGDDALGKTGSGTSGSESFTTVSQDDRDTAIEVERHGERLVQRNDAPISAGVRGARSAVTRLDDDLAGDRARIGAALALEN